MLTGLVKEEPGEKGKHKGKIPGERLTEGMEDGLLQTASPLQARGKSLIQREGDGLGAIGPSHLPERPGRERFGREKSPFDRHGHAVAGERRNHGKGVPDANPFLLRRAAGTEGDRGDTGEGVFIPGDPLQSLAEGGARLSPEPGFPPMDEIRNSFPGAKQTADIDPIFLHRTEADITVRSEVHFQIVTQRDIEGVGLEPDPAPSFLPHGGLASNRGDPTLRLGR